MTTVAREQARVGSARPRITIDVTPEVRREIRLEAAKRDISITEYVAGLIELGRDAERARQGNAEKS